MHAGLRRRGARAGFARPHPARPAADARGAGRGRRRRSTTIDVVAYTRGPGLAGALLVGAGVACALAAALGKPALGVHHLEGHLLSPFLSADPPEFPFVALLVSGGHTQLMRGRATSARYDAARRHHRRRRRRGLRQVGQAARPRLPGRAGAGAARRVRRSRGLRLAAAAAAARHPRLLVRRAEDRGAHACAEARGANCEQPRANLAASTQEAIVDVLVRKIDGRAASAPACAGSWSPAASARTRCCARACAPNARSASPGCHYPGAGALHRQRRDDRARRGDAACSAASPRCRRLRVRRAAALAADVVEPPAAVAG